MTTLTRWDPFREMMALRSSMDRMFDDSIRSMRLAPQGNGDSVFSLAVDVVENEDEYIVRASLPGISQNDLEITMENNVLTISGEYRTESTQENEHYLVKERREGQFRRSITLPATIDEGAIAAQFDNGVLAITLPKAEVAKPKRITVNAQKTVEAEAA